MYIVVVSTVWKLTDSHSAPHADHWRKLNAKRKDTIAPDIGLHILEAATISHSLAIDMAKLPYASSGFVRQDDCPDTRKLNACSKSSTISLHSITHK